MPRLHGRNLKTVVEVGRRLPDLPAQLRGRRRRRHRRPGRDRRQARLPRAPRRRRASGSPRSIPRRRTTPATTSRDYQGIDPVFGTLEVFDALLAGVARARDEARDGPRRQPHVGRARVVRGVRAQARLPSATGTGGAGAPPSRTTGARSSPAPPGSCDEATGEYYLHLFSRKQPDLNWENPAVREAVYAMMRWWLDRGVDGFRMDVINLISKPPGLPDGGRRRRSSVSGGPRLHEFLQEMHREVFDGRDGLLTVGETPGVTLEQARLFTDPRAARGRHGLPVRARPARPGREQVGPAPAAADRAEGDRSGRWQAGLADVGWNSLYWNNHDQPRASRASATTAALPRALGQVLGTVLHLHRGTPYVYQGEELGMTNAPFAAHRRLPRHRVAQPLRRGGRAPAATPRTCCARCARWAATTRARRCSGTRRDARRLHHRHAVDRRSTRTTPRSTPQAERDDPDSVFHHYRRLIELRHAEPAVAPTATSRCSLPDHERSTPSRAPTSGTELLVVGNVSGEEATPDIPAEWADTELCWATASRARA